MKRSNHHLVVMPEGLCISESQYILIEKLYICILNITVGVAVYVARRSMSPIGRCHNLVA